MRLPSKVAKAGDNFFLKFSGESQTSVSLAGMTLLVGSS